MRNIKLILEYDGTNYSGWQWQDGKPTIQGALEEAIRRSSGEGLRVTASGRTDAGVHALGQVVSFSTGAGLNINNWKGALNYYMPRDIRVLDVCEVPPEFNARHSAKGKTYEYIILNRPTPSPLRRNYAWHIGYPLDALAMKEAATHLVGEHDFTSLRAKDCDAKSPVRQLWRLDVDSDGETIRFSVGASAFLKHMVRNIVGTLVEVGRGRFAPGGMKAILEARDRTKAGPTAPPQGLYLVKVDY